MTHRYPIRRTPGTRNRMKANIFSKNCAIELVAIALSGTSVARIAGGLTMLPGKNLFARLMDYLSWTTSSPMNERYGDNHRFRTLPCAEHFRVPTFARLTAN